MQHLEIWKFLSGIGFFLYGMSQLENVMKTISGRPLKLFLQRNTQNLFKAIVGSAIITGIVQSSSVVSLLVLAFVEAGIITFRNALGVILGANLGTTLDSWIVATVGFKFDVLSYSLPVIAITAIAMFFLERRKKLYNLFAVFFALGILFLGLGFMKDGAEQLVKTFDLKSYSHYGIFVFVIIGFVLTTIIQSSSATIAITLTAIHSGVINFPSAAAIVIGSEVGTSIKILLWGMKGSADKKRVGWGNFIYNIFTTIIALISLHWLIYFIEKIIHIKDPLIGLVFFQSAINILSILFFLPFLNVFAKWLGNRFKAKDKKGNSYVSQDLSLLPVDIDTLQHEAENLYSKSVLFIKSILLNEKPKAEGILKNIKSLTEATINIEDEYQRLKQTEGDLLAYYTGTLEGNWDKKDAKQLLNYVHAIRQSVYAAKAIKDIEHNLKEFEASANDVLHRQCAIISKEWLEFDKELHRLQHMTDNSKLFSHIDKYQDDAVALEEKQKSEVMNQLKKGKLSEIEASTLMNVHRELLSCKKSLLMGLSNIRNSGNDN